MTLVTYVHSGTRGVTVTRTSRVCVAVVSGEQRGTAMRVGRVLWWPLVQQCVVCSAVAGVLLGVLFAL